MNPTRLETRDGKANDRSSLRTDFHVPCFRPIVHEGSSRETTYYSEPWILHQVIQSIGPPVDDWSRDSGTNGICIH